MYNPTPFAIKLMCSGLEMALPPGTYTQHWLVEGVPGPEGKPVNQLVPMQEWQAGKVTRLTDAGREGLVLVDVRAESTGFKPMAKKGLQQSILYWQGEIGRFYRLNEARTQMGKLQPLRPDDYRIPQSELVEDAGEPWMDRYTRHIDGCKTALAALHDGAWTDPDPAFEQPEGQQDKARVRQLASLQRKLHDMETQLADKDALKQQLAEMDTQLKAMRKLVGERTTAGTTSPEVPLPPGHESHSGEHLRKRRPELVVGD